MPFDTYKMKKFFGTALKAALIITLAWGIISFMLHFNATGDWNPLNWSDFTYVITFLILEWIGYLILHGRINPNAFPNQPPRGRYPQQQRPQQYQQAYYQPQPIKSPPPKQRVPVQLSLDVCSFCGREVPINSLRVFRDDYGYTLHLCEDCIEYE